MTINDNSTKSINAAIIDLQNQIKQLQHKIGILSKNQLKEDDIEFPGKVEYADEAGKAKEADHAKTADTAKYASETENAVHAGYADIATKATQDGSGNVITDTYATKTEVAKEIQDVMYSNIYIPNPTFPGISYVIPAYRVQSVSKVDGVSIEGKTLQISFRLYKYVNSFSVQLSYGTTDGSIQQMSGVGRTWFVEIDQNDTDYFEDNEWKIFNKSVTIPQGNPIFGVGVNGCPICINSLKVV